MSPVLTVHTPQGDLPLPATEERLAAFVLHSGIDVDRLDDLPVSDARPEDDGPLAGWLADIINDSPVSLAMADWGARSVAGILADDDDRLTARVATPMIRANRPDETIEDVIACCDNIRNGVFVTAGVDYASGCAGRLNGVFTDPHTDRDMLYVFGDDNTDTLTIQCRRPITRVEVAVDIRETPSARLDRFIDRMTQTLD